MVVVVEGIDRVGKTTLCERLSIKAGIPIFKKERENRYIKVDKIVDAYTNYGNALGIVQLVNNNLVNDFIFDRFQWTEAVYSKIDRHNSEPIYLMKAVEEEMCKRPENWLMVYVSPTDIKRSEKEHGSDLSRHFGMYGDLAANTKLQCVMCNYDCIDKAVDRVMEIMRERKNEG